MSYRSFDVPSLSDVIFHFLISIKYYWILIWQCECKLILSIQKRVAIYVTQRGEIMRRKGKSIKKLGKKKSSFIKKLRKCPRVCMSWRPSASDRMCWCCQIRTMRNAASFDSEQLFQMRTKCKKLKKNKKIKANFHWFWKRDTFLYHI